MSDLVLLKCDIGSKAATVLCPECGRVSRQILSASYSPNRVAELIRPHTCPICETVYRNCNASQAGNWSAAFARYNRNADQYNQSVKDSYVPKPSTEVTPIASSVAPSQPVTSAQAQTQQYWFCGVAINQMSSTYSYLSDIGRINIGTSVVVPFGTNNAPKVGVVKTCQLLVPREAPYPLEKAKHIIRVATEEDMHPSKPVPPLFDTSSQGYATLASALKQVVEKKAEDPTETTLPGRSITDVQADGEKENTLATESTPSETPGQSPSSISISASVTGDTSVSPDEDLDRKIERWKRELLDTGKRNKMINYRETKRATLRILEPEASELFNKLAFSEKPLTFQKPINKDTDLRTYSMIALMETLSYR